MKSIINLFIFTFLFIQYPNSVPFEEIILYENGKGDYACYRIPALIKAPDGTLLSFIEGRKNNCSDYGNVDLLIRRSADNGLHWSPYELVVDYGELQAGNPAPVVDYTDPEYPEGRIFLFYNTGNASENDIRLGKGIREVWYKTSTDQGISWSEGINITSQVHFNKNSKFPAKDWRTHACTPGHAIQLTHGQYKGRLYIAANHSQGEPQEGFNEYRAYGFYSDDHGKTWSVSPDVAIPSSNEAIGVELPNGNLMLNIREQNGKTKTRLIAISKDGGQSWNQTYFDPNLISPVCQSSILRFESNDTSFLVYSGPNSTSKREKMTLKFSFDMGTSWEFEKEIFSGASAYSDLIQIDQKSLGLFFEKENKNTFVKIDLGWIDHPKFR
jgi:sialidase-1